MTTCGVSIGDSYLYSADRGCLDNSPVMYQHQHHLMYADDLVILAPSVAGLSKLLRICESFGESNDIVFNQKKSASLYFISKMLKGANLPNVDLHGVLVEQVDSVKYIGHFLTNELSDDIDIRRQCRVLNVRGNI